MMTAMGDFLSDDDDLRFRLTRSDPSGATMRLLPLQALLFGGTLYPLPENWAEHAQESRAAQVRLPMDGDIPLMNDIISTR